MSTTPWHIRNIRGLIYVGLFLTIAGIAYSSASWVDARELYGLWALGLLIAAMSPGPLNFVLPWLPIRAHLMRGRRALGVSAFILAVLHMGCYLGPVIYRNWHELYTPGKLWIAGLLLGLPVSTGMTVLAFTSRDRAVRELGAHRWKKWHRTVYWILAVALLHATFLGADFGVNKGPDVPGQPDAGSLVGMLIAAGAWLTFFILRKRRIRWTSTG